MIWLYILLLNPESGGVNKVTHEWHSSYATCTAAGQKKQQEWKALPEAMRAGQQLVTVCLYNDPKIIGAHFEENPLTAK